MPYAARTCPVCEELITVTRRQRKALREGLTLRHDSCGGPVRKRDRRGQHQPARHMGCIVSTLLPNGEPRVYFEAGHTIPALRSICSRLVPGQVIEAISTPRTIARDLQHVPRQAVTGGQTRTANPAANPRDSGPRVDPWAAERVLLAKAGCGEWLTPQARIASRVHLEPRRLFRRR